MPEHFTCHQAAKGRYSIQVVERKICRTVRRRAAAGHGIAARFAAKHGRTFSGTAADLELLDPADRARVDAAVARAIAEDPNAWVTSPATVVEDRPEVDNLILNQGLNNVAGRVCSWRQFGTYCALGTGAATPAVTDTILGAEVVRTNNLLGALVVTDDNPSRTRTFARTFDFPAETVNRNYTEVGVSHAASGSTSLNTRALLSGGTVTVLVGQQARVAYSVAVTVAADTVATPTATGWPVPPATTVQGTAYYRHLDAVENFHDSAELVLSSSSTVPAFGTVFSVSGTRNSSFGFNAYTAGTFKSSRWAKWALGDGNSSSLRMVYPYTYPISNGFAFIFDQAQTKDNLHELTITWSVTYGRV